MRAWRAGALPIATCALWLGACGEVDIVDHDPLVLEPEGNFPDAAEERCGPLPPGIVPIPELATAWAMTKVPVDEVDLSFRAATTTFVLRLSSDGVPCGVPLEPELVGCPSAWAVDVTIRNAEVAPGRFALEDYGQGWDLATAHREERACVGNETRGTFEAGELEIFTVTEDCVVGRLVGTGEQLPAAAASVEGGFVALRCDPEE